MWRFIAGARKDSKRTMLSRKLSGLIKKSTSVKYANEHRRPIVTSDRAKIKIKLKMYREQLYNMAEALEAIDDRLCGDSAKEYVEGAISHIDKASNTLFLASAELESNKHKGE